MRRLILASLVALLAHAALAPFQAGAEGRSPLGLAVSPPLLLATPGHSQRVTVTNQGPQTLTASVSLGDYGVRPDGELILDPRTTPARSARRWLAVSPTRLVLEPGQARTLRIGVRTARAYPGDYHALVYITSAATGGEVSLAARLGVNVVVRVPGSLVRDLRVDGLRVHRAGGAGVVRLVLSNRGNVVERLLGGQVTVALRQGKAHVVLQAHPLDLLPGTSRLVSIPYTGSLRGRAVAVATVRPLPADLAGPHVDSSPRPVRQREWVHL